jgi:hypothetical protein
MSLSTSQPAQQPKTTESPNAKQQQESAKEIDSMLSQSLPESEQGRHNLKQSILQRVTSAVEFAAPIKDGAGTFADSFMDALLSRPER